jgi:tellurite methyltransferase
MAMYPNSKNPKPTVYEARYQSKENYWEFKPSSMIQKVLELLPPLYRRPKVLEIGCGEGATAVFLARNGYDVTAFDLAPTAIDKTLENGRRAGVEIAAFVADVNEFVPNEKYDLIFSSGTLQYLLPERRAPFMQSLQAATQANGLNVLHTFVTKPFVPIAPDAEDNEHLWDSGELLTLYKDWHTEAFVEEIKLCNSSGVSHRHAHNRLWSRRV